MIKNTIYFIAGSTPTKAEAADIKKVGAKRIRNASLVEEGACREKCDTVMGAVPEKYKDVKGIRVIEAPKVVKGTGGSKKADTGDNSLE